MKIISMGVEQIREIYFEEVPEQDDESFPTITRARLLVAEFEGTTEKLQDDFLGWHFHFLHWSQLLWSSEQHRAAFLQLGYGRVTDIYLFTFADASSFQAGVEEIKEVCRRTR